MKHFFLLALVFYSSTITLAQNGLYENSISAITNNSLFFTYQTIDELLNDKVIDNAVSLNVNSQKSKCVIYGQVVFTDGVPDEITAQRISLKLKNSTSSNFTPANYSQIRLSVTPVLLFEQEKASNVNLFNYDVVLQKQSSFEKLGNHNFSIVFTLVEP